MYRLLIMSLLFVVIQSCSANDKELVTMKFSPHELAEQLILELDNKNISYKFYLKKDPFRRLAKHY